MKANGVIQNVLLIESQGNKEKIFKKLNKVKNKCQRISKGQ